MVKSATSALSMLAVMIITASKACPALASPQDVRALLAQPVTSVLVVAHRGCHTPAPHHGLLEPVPENSIAAIERCVDLGVDFAEVDVRRTKDGYLVLIHDETVDRTTDGTGKVADLTLAQVTGLRLRQGEGGPAAAIAESRGPTLEEGLAAADGRIALNLDVQGGLYPEVIAAVVRSGQQDQVIVKYAAAAGSPVLADTPPFDQIPFMPVLAQGGDLVAIARRQVATARTVGLELPRMSASELPALAEIASAARVRLWVNSLWEGFIEGFGGDIEALRDPDKVWGRMRRAGVTIIQTDEPEALMRYLGR